MYLEIVNRSNRLVDSIGLAPLSRILAFLEKNDLFAREDVRISLDGVIMEPKEAEQFIRFIIKNTNNKDK